MGFSVHYITTDVVSPRLQSEIEAAVEELVAARSWMSCEPPYFSVEAGHLAGSVKPLLSEPANLADEEDLPDGTLGDALEVLCVLSLRFEIEWEVGHDHIESVGFIRQGRMDLELASQADVLSQLPGLIADSYDEQKRYTGPHGDEAPTSDDDDDGPNILKFPG